MKPIIPPFTDNQRRLVIPLTISDHQQQLMMPTSPANSSEMMTVSVTTTEELLGFLDQALHHVEGALQGLEANHDLLGPAILRKCNEFADGVQQLANELENYSHEELKQLAQACQRDCPSLTLPHQHHNQQKFLSTQDWENAIQGATVLLRDVEAAFREVCSQDAEEIADVTLMVARIFLMTLQSIHSSIEEREESIINNATTNNKSNVTIQELTNFSSNPPKSPTESSSSNTNKRRQERVRVLWPPLGPAVTETCEWGKDAAIKNPLLAAAIGLTLWPATIGTAFIGGGVVLADSAIQDAYNHFQDAPLIRTVEEFTAHFFFSMKLFIVGTKFAARQTLRVVSRQVERNGGLGEIVHNVGGMALDRAMNPLETAGMLWDGLTWGIGFASDTVQSVIEQKREQKVMEQEL